MNYDLCIIGGGINGVAIAKLAAQHNIKTILLEKTSLGSGASSKTSKLAHGGLRYLEQFNFGLVREALKERNDLLKIHSDTVTPLPFIYPVSDKELKLKVWAGMTLYDLLSYGSPMPKSKRFTIDKTLLHLPWLISDNIKYSYCYYDAIMDDYQIVIDVASEAIRNGALICENEEVLNVNQLQNRVEIKTTNFLIQSKFVINSTGAWSNNITGEDHVRPSKGAHIITNKIQSEYASILRSPKDGRVFFTIPYKKNTIIGTTDTFYNGDLDNIVATNDDILYIIESFNSFSKIKLTKEDVLDTYAGLRPLANSKGLLASALSRDVSYIKQGKMLSIVGGKYTTHRAVARDIIKRIKKYV